VSDFVEQAREAIKKAAESRSPLRIEGGGTKAFYGRRVGGNPLHTGAHRGMVEYEPSELVFTARAGTPLSEIEASLAEHGQILPFEPPHFGDGATIGGALATGLSGPRRPYAGAARDLLLGCRIINGFGEALSFGGKVMKNVAGYDVSRLMVGALGTLGVIVEVSVKVLPRSVTTVTLAFDYNQGEAIDAMNRWAGRPFPISATCHDGARLLVRLSGAEAGVRSAQSRLGGEVMSDADFWTGVREQQHPFFQGAGSIWRISVPPATPPLALSGATLLEWNGALRWVATDATAGVVRGAAAAAGGHATWFRGHDGDDVFHPLEAPRLALHRNLKRAFDPHGVLNPGRMYADI
jgi:glycolate oxidase FAD binding subunit